LEELILLQVLGADLMATRGVKKRREWTERMERFRRSGKTVAAFCASESISTVSFYRWRGKLDDDAQASAQATSSRLKPVQLALSVPAAPAMTVRLAEGIEIEVARDAQVMSEVLQQILAQHAALPCREPSSC
jgi:hypothetical protein